MRQLLYVVLLLIFISCSTKNQLPGDVLAPAKMQEVLLAIMTADALNNERALKDTSLRVPKENAAHYQTIFALHKITREEFAKSYRFYLKRPDLLKPITDSLNNLLAKKNTELERMQVKKDSASAVMNKDSLKRAGGKMNLLNKDSVGKRDRFKLFNKDSIKQNGGNIKNAAGQVGDRQ